MLIQRVERPQSATLDTGSAAPAAEPSKDRHAPPAPGATSAQLNAAVDQANKSMQSIDSTVQFEVDPDTNVMVIRIVDSSDHQVIRQVPTEEMLRIAKSLEQQLQGALLNEEV